MNTITPAAIYRAIFAGQTVIVACPPDKYPSLRVALQKQHQTPVALDLTNDSLKSSYNREKGIATFKLGPKRAASGFTLVEVTDGTDSATSEVREDLDNGSG